MTHSERPPLCACGCGEEVRSRDCLGMWRKYATRRCHIKHQHFNEYVRRVGADIAKRNHMVNAGRWD